MSKRTKAEKRARAKRVFKNIFWVLGQVITLGLLAKNRSK